TSEEWREGGWVWWEGGGGVKGTGGAIAVIVEQFQRMADEPVPAEELEKARSLAKGRFVLHTESPQGLIMFGLRREVLEGQALEPGQILAELDKGTVEDVQRVGPELIAPQTLPFAPITPLTHHLTLSPLSPHTAY